MQMLSCQNVCDALSYLCDNIRFGTKLYRQSPTGTNCASIVVEFFSTIKIPLIIFLMLIKPILLV